MRHFCACCGHATLDEPPGRTGQICPVCFWEDSRIPEGDAGGWNGSNGVSLEEAQDNFQEMGACSPAFVQGVRPARPEESRDPAFLTIRGAQEASEAETRSLIHAAFAGLGGGTSLREAALECFGDPLKESPPFDLGRIRGWHDLTHETLCHSYFASAPSFLDPRGYRYHLPAYLCCWLDIHREEDPFGVLDRILWSLRDTWACPGVLARDGWHKDRFEILTASQRHAVAHFLQHLARYETDTQTREDAQEALDRGWSDLLAPAAGA